MGQMRYVSVFWLRWCGVGGVVGEWVGGFGQGGGGCYVCMCCESVLSVLKAGPDIFILC